VRLNCSNATDRRPADEHHDPGPRRGRERLRIASDALKFLADNVAETMEEATTALAEAKEALGAVRAKRRIMQVTGTTEGGDTLALTTDGSLWRLHTFKDLEIWSPVDPLPEGSPLTATRAEEDL
jgi:hypothetical protein